MTWVKLDDGFADHPKVAAAGHVAAWVYVAGLCYCSRQLTDGFIPTSVLRRLTDVPKPEQHAARLVEVGLWETCDGGWCVHNYADHQRTREQVDADREKWREKKKKQRNTTVVPGGHSGDTPGSPRDVPPPETETETETEVCSGSVSSLSRTNGRNGTDLDPFENDPRWVRLADTMESRDESRANTFRTIRRLINKEGIADHLVDAAAGQTIAKDGAGLGYLTMIVRDWYDARTGV